METVPRLLLTNAVWAAALALAAVAIVRIGRGRPSLSHGLWLLVLLKLGTPGLWSLAAPAAEARADAPIEVVPLPVDRPIPAPIVGLGPVEPIPISADEPRGPGFDPWKLGLVAWVAGAFGWWLLVAIQAARFGRLAREATPASKELVERARGIAGALGLRGVPSIHLIPAVIPPMLWALVGRPRVFLPQSLWDRLDEPQQDAVIAHELAHLRRGDHWVRRLEAVVLGVYWWNPFAWWARREVGRAEERCCDARVAWALPGLAPSYAEALVATAEFLSGPRQAWPIGASGSGCVPLLKGRLAVILEPNAPRPSSGAILLLAALALPLLPNLADAQAPAQLPATVPPTKPAVVDGPAPAPATKEVRPGDLPRVRVAQPIRREVAGHEMYVGRAQAAKSASIRPRIGGTLTRVEAKPGAVVKAGDLLFELDSRPLQAEFDRTQARYNASAAQAKLAATVLARTKALAARGVISPDEMTKAEAEADTSRAMLASSQADVDIARLNLGFCRIEAPFGGRLVDVRVEPGTVVNADVTPLATLVAADPIAVEFDMVEGMIVWLKRQRREAEARGEKPAPLPVVVSFPSGDRSKTYAGAVDYLPDSLDPERGTARLRTLLANPTGEILPGMFAQVGVITRPAKETILVPATALSKSAGGPSDFTVHVVDREGFPGERRVKAGQAFGDFRVVEGLGAEDWIVVNLPDLYSKDASGTTRYSSRINPDRVPLTFTEEIGLKR